MARSYLISLGSNFGNREKFVQTAILFISQTKEISILKKSNILNTEALEVTDQPDFLNMIMKINTCLEPIQLLDLFQLIEKKIGRIKRFDKGPREIDLDILYSEDLFFKNDRLTIPHHSLFTRPFIKKLLIQMNEQYIYNSLPFSNV